MKELIKKIGWYEELLKAEMQKPNPAVSEIRKDLTELRLAYDATLNEPATLVQIQDQVFDDLCDMANIHKNYQEFILWDDN